MRKFDKKDAWETVEVVYWRGNVKCHETLQHFFQKDLCITSIRL